MFISGISLILFSSLLGLLPVPAEASLREPPPPAHSSLAAPRVEFAQVVARSARGWELLQRLDGLFEGGRQAEQGRSGGAAEGIGAASAAALAISPPRLGDTRPRTGSPRLRGGYLPYNATAPPLSPHPDRRG